MFWGIFRNKNLNSVSSVESLDGINETSPPTSSIPQLKPGAESDPAVDAKKDGHGFILCLREEEKKGNYSQTTKSNDLACCFGAKYHDKDCVGGSIYNLPEMSHSNIAFQCDKSSLNHKEPLRESSGNTYLGFARDGTEENMPQIKGRNIDVSVCPVENDIASSMKSSRVSSTSFEFHVMSEEGINLHVDLNSSPSDWAKRFKNEVDICKGVHGNRSPSFHQGLGHFGETDKQVKNSCVWNMDSGQINNSHVPTTFSPSSKTTENDHMGFEQPDKGDASLLSCAIVPCSVVIDVSENSKKDQVLIPSEPNSNTQDQINSAAESCAKDQCTVILDTNATDTPPIKSACNSVVNSMSDGPLSPLQLKDQNSNFVDEIFENSTLQNSCSIVNPSLVYPGCSASGSMEMPTSEVASCHKDASCSPYGNGGFLDLVDPKLNTETEQGGLANSSELDHDTCRNLLPTCVEEWERSNIINGRESSECSQIDNSVGRTCLSSNDMESKELHKKRKHVDREDKISYYKPDAKILRSSKHSRKVLPRRSMRLITK
ncbi:uncharacterized protein LOC132186304 isoform X2 [Corylus avellana]|uniref:uncharacterized protein LOC132186304 isoform X2 n=1 Tax=Corylus avellana TaxID=13451 RepID=UPI00286B4426|nr:uncharacterized protein LOC132186304 isoform X2 [Corylus avellana]XP_059456209.1 uncharacterized protein LOC132186304 isoform X2 [Corylus avellana]